MKVAMVVRSWARLAEVRPWMSPYRLLGPGLACGRTFGAPERPARKLHNTLWPRAPSAHQPIPTFMKKSSFAFVDSVPVTGLRTGAIHSRHAMKNLRLSLFPRGLAAVVLLLAASASPLLAGPPPLVFGQIADSITLNRGTSPSAPFDTFLLWLQIKVLYRFLRSG